MADRDQIEIGWHWVVRCATCGTSAVVPDIDERDPWLDAQAHQRSTGHSVELLLERRTP